MKDWLRKVLGMNKVVEPEPTLADERAMRRALVVSDLNRRAHQAQKNHLTATGEMKIIQRRAEKQWYLENDDTTIIPRIEL